MKTDLITKFVRIIVILIVLLIGLTSLLIYIYLSKCPEEKTYFRDVVYQSDDISEQIIMNRSLYRYSANFIDTDFNPQMGKQLFKDNCMSCHMVGEGINSTGPSLFNLFERIPHNPSWIFEYLKDSKNLIKEGDKYAIEFKRKSKLVKYDHRFTNLNKTELNDLIGFIGMNKK